MWFKSECNKISDRLWDYSAQRLSASETAQVESHLQHCSQCQAEAEAYRQTVGLLGSARSMPVPASQKTWQDLRPSLAPARRPILRSADFLPRLTLAGAGTALAATLLVVFMSGGHRPLQPIAAGTSSNGQPTPVAVGPVTPSTTHEAVAQNDPNPAETMSSVPPIVGSFFSAPPSILLTPDPEVKPKFASTPKVSPPHPHNFSRFTGSTPHPGRRNAVANVGDTEAQLDGGNVAPRAQQNYVLNPVSPSGDDETTHRYVISSIPASQNGRGMVASNDEEEGRAW